MIGVEELRLPTAGRLLTIRREVRMESGDDWEQAALCNARVLAESCYRGGRRMFADGGAVLAALTFAEMEALVRQLTLQRAAESGAVNPKFEPERFARAQREAAGELH